MIKKFPNWFAILLFFYELCHTIDQDNHINIWRKGRNVVQIYNFTFFHRVHVIVYTCHFVALWFFRYLFKKYNREIINDKKIYKLIYYAVCFPMNSVIQLFSVWLIVERRINIVKLSNFSVSFHLCT